MLRGRCRAVDADAYLGPRCADDGCNLTCQARKSGPGRERSGPRRRWHVVLGEIDTRARQHDSDRAEQQDHSHVQPHWVWLLARLVQIAMTPQRAWGVRNSAGMLPMP